MNAKFQVIAFSILMGTIILLAYFGLIPTKLHDIPYYDRAGHFVLYGLWGYFFGNAFRKPIIVFGNFHIDTGIIIAIIVATVEEFLQQLSPMRSFSYTDLGYGLTGIAISCILLNLRRKKTAE